MHDCKGVVPLSLRLNGMANHLTRTAKLGQSMQLQIRRNDAVYVEVDAGPPQGVERMRERLAVGRLLIGIDETLIPDVDPPRLGHWPSRVTRVEEQALMYHKGRLEV